MSTTGDHDDDRDKESPTSAAFIAMLKKWRRSSPRHNSCCMGNGKRNWESNSRNKIHCETALLHTTDEEMNEWLDNNDPDGSYRKVHQSGEELLLGYQKNRDGHNKDRLDAVRVNKVYRIRWGSYQLRWSHWSQQRSGTTTQCQSWRRWLQPS